MVEYALLAEKVRRFTELDEQSSPFSYANRLFLQMEPCPGAANGAELRGRRIFWDPHKPRNNQRASVAREICRWLLRQSDADESAVSVRFLSAAMFPAFAPVVSLKPPRLHLISSTRRAVVASRQAQADFRGRVRRQR